MPEASAQPLPPLARRFRRWRAAFACAGYCQCAVVRQSPCRVGSAGSAVTRFFVRLGFAAYYGIVAVADFLAVLRGFFNVLSRIFNVLRGIFNVLSRIFNVLRGNVGSGENLALRREAAQERNRPHCQHNRQRRAAKPHKLLLLRFQRFDTMKALNEMFFEHVLKLHIHKLFSIIY